MTKLSEKEYVEILYWWQALLQTLKMYAFESLQFPQFHQTNEEQDSAQIVF